MKINYNYLARLMKYSGSMHYYTFKTKNDINGHSRKLVVYEDLTFYENDPSIDYDNILISYMTKKELNELKKTLISHGFTERTGGEN